jgi:hypothetical protein
MERHWIDRDKFSHSQSVSQSVNRSVRGAVIQAIRRKAQDESKGESSQSGLAAARQNQSDEGGAYKIDPPPLSFSARPTTKLRRARCFCSLPPLFFFAVYTTSPTTHRRLLHIMAVRAQFENSNEYVLRGAGGVVFGMAKVANGGAESVSSRHLPTHTQLLPSVHPRTSTGTGSQKTSQTCGILTVARQCLRGRAAGCDPHLPRHNCRDADYRATDGR